MSSSSINKLDIYVDGKPLVTPELTTPITTTTTTTVIADNIDKNTKNTITSTSSNNIVANSTNTANILNTTNTVNSGIATNIATTNTNTNLNVNKTITKPSKNNSSINIINAENIELGGETTTLINDGAVVKPVNPNSQSAQSKFAQRKAVSTGLLDIALMVANFTHLREIVTEEPLNLTTLKICLIVAICLSLLFQVIIAISLLYVARGGDPESKHYKRLQCWNNIVIVLVVLITVVDIFISVFIITNKK